MIEVTQEMVSSWIPTRREDAHKGDFGRVHILAGSSQYTGAPYFAAEAATRTGSGLVYLTVPENIWPILAVKCNEPVVMGIPSPDDSGFLLFERMNSGDAALIGPGIGSGETQGMRVRRLVKALAVPLVLDADGINAMQGHIDMLKERAYRLTVLTPHEGEFARLWDGYRLGDVREEAALAFAKESGCVLVLKGHRTVTAFPDGSLYVNTTGNPGMAKGGSGDVLAGMILSLLGQGLLPEQAVPAAVFLHGRAGDLSKEELGEYGMTPTDMLRNIARALKLE